MEQRWLMGWWKKVESGGRCEGGEVWGWVEQSLFFSWLSGIKTPVERGQRRGRPQDSHLGRAALGDAAVNGQGRVNCEE